MTVTADAVSGEVLRAEQVTRTYGSGGRTVAALAEASLVVNRGTFVAITGPSGSGKSTLLHLLAGLDRPSSGEVFIDGQPISRMSDRSVTEFRRDKVGMVFQAYNLVGVLTAAQNVMLPLTLAGVARAAARERAHEVLTALGMGHLSDRLPAALSGGEQQRVAIARALAPRPAVVLADEPTGSLDSESTTAVVDVLRRAHAEFQQAVVVATHDPSVASAADEVVRLHDGRVHGTLTLRGRGAKASARSVLSWLSEPVAVGADG